MPTFNKEIKKKQQTNKQQQKNRASMLRSVYICTIRPTIRIVATIFAAVNQTF